MSGEFSLRLLREGYPAAGRARDGADAVPIRLLGRRSVLVGGPRGVRRFYAPDLRRHGAFPRVIRLPLFGPGAVHGLDDEEHHVRKGFFTTVVTPDSVRRLRVAVASRLRERTETWAADRSVDLFDQAVAAIGVEVLRWSGADVDDDEAARRSRDLAAIVDGFATPVRPYLAAVGARRRADRWARGLVEAERRTPAAPEGSALAVVAAWRDPGGALLPSRTAAVEYLNVVRPTVATAWFVAAAGVALDREPEARERIAAGDHAAAAAFAQEVRRHHPFVPVLAARTRRRTDVLGVEVPRGGYVVLDVDGTDRDPRSWTDGDRFVADRFLAGGLDADALVPQGGGTVPDGHRCPGEPIVLGLLTDAVAVLADRARLAPGQDTRVSLTRFPTRPADGPLVCPLARS